MLLVAACGGATTSETTTPEVEPTPDLQVPIEELLVYVPAGSFQMGSVAELDPLARPDEFPSHVIGLDGFHIFRNEVTNGLYGLCVEAGVCSPPTELEEEGPSQHYGEEEYKDHPIVGVTWDQAVAFCTWVDARLPTEAEWEKTARGELGDLYPWGDEAPTCDRSNMESCVPETLTDKIGQYPNGESEYLAKDMSGNVWEWTADWYKEDYYAVSGRFNPLGPDNGELKVIRGGSFQDGVDDLRSAARAAVDPEQGYNNVGFRCVPIGLPSPGTAPFCQPSYIPFCTDPNNPGGDCTPPPSGEGTTPTGPDFEWLGFTCPQGGFITFTIDAGGPAADDYEVTINGITYDCVDSTVNPGRMICTGTAQPQNTFVTITACPNESGNNGNQLVSLTPTPDAGTPDRALVAFQGAQEPQTAQLVAFQPQSAPAAGLQGFQPVAPSAPLVAYQAATNGYCPEGMTLNPDTQQCESNPNGACPDGWSYDETTGQCTPPDDTACPEGTSYNADQQGCTPDDGSSCPSPYLYDEATGLCQPPANDDGGGACPAGYFYDRNILCCSPIQGGNNDCAEGTFRSAATGACEPLDQNGCPEGTVYNRYEGSCVPTTGDGQTDTPTTQRTVGGCEQDQYFDPASQQCIDLPAGECGAGYYFDANMQTCRPTDGPGSGCAIGYAFSERLNCCVATPGNDGSTCAGEPSQTGQVLSSFTALAAPSLTGYDAGGGYCDPGTDNNGCPSGYAYNESTGTCQPLAGAAQPPNTDTQACEEGYYYDEFYGLCMPNGFEPTGDSCAEGQYFDYELGYCVQTSCGCALGFTFNTDTQTCEPSGQTAEQGCWSVTQSVPSCPFEPEATPVCGRGESYQPTAGTCVPDEVNCGAATNANVCNAAGCDWVCTSSAYVCGLGPSYASYECR